MTDDVFDSLERSLESGGATAAFDFLVEKFRDEKKYATLFEVRMMKTRHELGLPLIQTEPSAYLPAEKRDAYEQATIEAAREVGCLFLGNDDIPRAWPYYRAIGEPGPVAEAIEQLEAEGENLDRVIEIAYHERVHPKKGLELILANHGICRAITFFGQYPGPEGREESAALLVNSLHKELAATLKSVIARQEGQAPETDSVSELAASRAWLFEGNTYHIDMSHVSSVVQMSPELTNPQTLKRVVELTDYGKRLSSMFQFQGHPPFENVYVDHGIYLRALLGENVEAGIAHFRDKVTSSDPHEVGYAPAEVLVKLLVRLERYPEAVEVSCQYLGDANPNELSCPSTVQLCQLAGDYRQLGDLAREKGDLLSFAAASLQS